MGRFLTCAALCLASLAASPRAARALLDVAVTATQAGATTHPGGPVVEVFRLTLQNTTLSDVKLTSISFENRASASSAQKDAVWQPLELVVDSRIIIEEFQAEPGTITATTTFSGGIARFTGLNVNIPAAGTTLIHIRGGASLTARDGDALDLRIANAQAITLSNGLVPISGSFPLDPAAVFPVDGMSAQQIALEPVDTPTVAVGSTRNLALDVTIPANGYQTDVLQRLAVQNLGTARPAAEMAAMEAWLDDGDKLFAPAADVRLGALAFTGDRWQLTGLSVPIPLAGLQVFVSVDVAEQSEPGRTVRLSLPTYLPGTQDPAYLGVGVASANDGPVNGAVSNPSAQAIAVVDRITLATKPLDPGFVRPGGPDVTLLELVATNTYAVDQRLVSLAASNASLGSGSQAEVDAELQGLALREDLDDDGVLEPGDPTIATGVFVGGRAGFGGFSWDLPAGKTRRLFVTGDVSLLGSADGDVLAASVAGVADLGFAAPTAVSAIFPLGPGSAWTVDGMVAAQAQNRGAPALTLGPNEGPAPALDLVVRPNGYRDDTLEGLVVGNLGDAAAADLAEVRLWRDGGDGQASGDDQDLGPMVESAGQWRSGALAVPLSGPGARLFVTVRAAATPTDSAMVRMFVPVQGIAVASGNDGPLDQAIVNPDALLLTDRALLASLDVDPSAVIVGQPVAVRMTVRNLSGEVVQGVTPSALAVLGSAALTYASGPSPAAADLPSGGQQVFTWSYTAASAGESRLSGSAAGVGSPSGTPRQSLPAASDAVAVFEQADRLPWTASSAMPLTVNRGQTNLAPLFLTFGNDSASASSDVRVTGLRLGIESQSGAGIVPASLLARVAVRVGAVTHVERLSLETAGSEVDLTLATPILVPASSPVTAAIALDVSATTVEPNFRLVIADSSFLRAEDAVTGAPVVLSLEAQSYPVRTGLTRVVEEATLLDVAAVAGPAIEAGRGQADVPFATLGLTNPGVSGVTSDVRVASFAVTLRDSSGAAVVAPSQVLARLRVRVGPQLLADRPVTAAEDSVMDLTLSPLLAVPVNSPLEVRITADLSPAATLGRFRLALADSSLFDARDPNSGNPVAVVYRTHPTTGDPVTVEAAAESVMVRGEPRMPPAVGVGASGVVALSATLRHPGSPGAAAARLDSLVVRCLDEQRNPVAPGLYVERLELRWNGVPVAALADPPATGNAMSLGLPGLEIEPGERDTLTLALDFEAAAPPGTFELVLQPSGFLAADANTGAPLAVVAESGFEFPILSGLTRLSAPARTLVAGLDDRMPAALAADGAEIVAGTVTLVNDAAPGSGSLAVDRLGIRAADAAGAPITIGAVAQTVRLYQGSTPWAEATLLAGDTLATLSGAQLILSPQAPATLELRFVARVPAGGPGLRLGFGAAEVGVVQPTNPLLAIAVQPPSGESFPQWTEFGGFAAASLEQSWSNFPNPFAAGREATRFAYWLPSSGRVTLTLWTPRGERVARLLDGAPRAAGLHQDDAWDGRNGNGAVVANGVYVAEIVVQLDGGERRRLLRKVAVVR